MRTQYEQLSEGSRIQLSVIGSLVLRELGSRWGRENIGFLWFVAEPLMFGTVIALLHKLNHTTDYGGDITALPFTIIGYCIYIIFRNIFNRAEGVIESGAPLFYHRMVTVFDLLVARVLVDALGCIFSITILLGFSASIGAAPLPQRPLYLLSAIGLMVWWTLALTMIAATISYRNEIVGRQLHIISYFSIPISGAFYQLSWIPPALRDVLRWFPMALIFEQARYGEFRSAAVTYVDPAYVSFWCAALTYIGLLLVRRRRRNLYA